MLVSKAHSVSQQSRLALTLAWVAGYTNVICILACGTVTSHVTGSVSHLGRVVIELNAAQAGFLAFLVLTFVLGAAISGALTEKARRFGWESIYVLPMLVQAGLLLLFALGIEFWDTTPDTISRAHRWILSGLASTAMGLQNATITRISNGVVRTTHLTGVLTDIGIESAILALGSRDGAARPTEQTRAAGIRVLLLCSIVLSFMVGAGLGTVAFERFHDYSMIPPVAFLFWIVWQDVRTPICELESIGSDSTPNAVPLPREMVVYRLRRDRKRGGILQRLPDLIQWIERLPEETRVAVLDLTEVTVLDDNAGLQLGDVARRGRERGMTVILGGLPPARVAYLELDSPRVGIDLDNVFSDGKTAIAHGFALLDVARARALAVGG
ncbi:MAG: YoaK family protein [Phycisphaerae bacterium]|nr:YoaK family protein [Phycisphaerae bacterium]